MGSHAHHTRSIERVAPIVRAHRSVVSVNQTLFGKAYRTRRWGIGTTGQSMTHEREQDAVVLFLDFNPAEARAILFHGSRVKLVLGNQSMRGS